MRETGRTHIPTKVGERERETDRQTETERQRQRQTEKELVGALSPVKHRDRQKLRQLVAE